jgi:hypothetical protein
MQHVDIAPVPITALRLLESQESNNSSSDDDDEAYETTDESDNQAYIEHMRKIKTPWLLIHEEGSQLRFPTSADINPATNEPFGVIYAENSQNAAIQAELMCGICLGIMIEPLTLASCGHTFCTNCLDGSEHNRVTRCPNCREAYASTELRTVTALQNILSTMAVCCPVNCGWISDLAKCEAHLEKECPRRQLQCTVSNRCTAELFNTNIAEHVANECGYRRVRAACCGIRVRTMDFAKHPSRCRHRIVLCSMGPLCEWKGRVKDQSEHVCPYTYVRCTIPGCRVYLRRHEMEAHLSCRSDGSRDKHKELLATNWVKIQSDLDEASARFDTAKRRARQFAVVERDFKLACKRALGSVVDATEDDS